MKDVYDYYRAHPGELSDLARRALDLNEVSAQTELAQLLGALRFEWEKENELP